MELWIRSQQKEMLFKVKESLSIRRVNNNISDECFIECDNKKIALYKTRERALEILDEISNKIKNKYIVKANCLIKPSDIMKEKEYFENTYDGDFIMQTPAYEIEPINPNIIYYEMPKE